MSKGIVIVTDLNYRENLPYLKLIKHQRAPAYMLCPLLAMFQN